MKAKLSIVRADIIRPLLTATLGLAITLTLNACGNHAWEEILFGSSSSEQEDSSSSSSKPSSSSSLQQSSSSSLVQTGIVYGEPVTYQGETYKTVVIGEQTWFQRNLNYAVAGSKCGSGSSLSDANTATCDTYGRLYDWATAMALPSKCNSTLSTNDADCAISTPNHRGICPSGWHIPSNAEWDALYRSVDGTSGTSSPYNSPTAGRYLKAKEDWNNCGPSGSGKAYLCEDTFGFSALPGGYGRSGGSFYNVGYGGDWW